MFNAFLRVQLAAFGSWFSGGNRSSGRARRGSKAGYAVLMAFVFFSVGSMFYTMFSAMAAPLHAAGLGFLYFSLCLLAAFCLMLLGSALTAKAQLFESRDNDLLLSLPLTPNVILGGRVLLLLAINYLFELLIAVPALICWLAAAPLSPAGAFAFALILLLLPLTATAFAALLGYLFSLLTARIRNKTLFSTLFFLVFMAAYFFFYSKIMRGVMNIAAVGPRLASGFRSALPLYVLSTAISDGNLKNLLLSVIGMVLPFLLAWALLSATFLRTVSAHRGFAKVRYRETAEKPASAAAALYRREFSRLFSSSAYLINSALGVFFLLAAAVALPFKWGSFSAPLASMGPVLPGLLTVGLCAVSTMTTISAPSISLEGKSLWIAQSLPVETWLVLRAKLLLHLSLAVPSILAPSAVLAVLLRPSLPDALLLFAVPLLFNALIALLGLGANLLWPNLNWTNETTAVKNSLGVLVAIFGGWLIAAIPAILFFVQSAVPPRTVLALFGALVLALCLLLRALLKTKGCARYRSL